MSKAVHSLPQTTTKKPFNSKFSLKAKKETQKYMKVGDEENDDIFTMT